MHFLSSDGAHEIPIKKLSISDRKRLSKERSIHTTKAESDLREGGKFSSRMEAKDGSFGFDFGGVYDKVKENELIEYTIGDGRKVKITFTNNGTETKIVETFEAENTNSIEMQKGGWQAILDNFKKYTETN